MSRIERDGTRRRTRLFRGFLSHYLIGDRYGRPGKGNDKGAVEGLVGWSGRNFMVPLPRFASLEARNLYLEQRCRERQGDVLPGHQPTHAAHRPADLIELVSLANTVARPPVTRSGPMRAQFKKKLESEPAST